MSRSVDLHRLFRSKRAVPFCNVFVDLSCFFYRVSSNQINLLTKPVVGAAIGLFLTKQTISLSVRSHFESVWIELPVNILMFMEKKLFLSKKEIGFARSTRAITDSAGDDTQLDCRIKPNQSQQNNQSYQDGGFGKGQRSEWKE